MEWTWLLGYRARPWSPVETLKAHLCVAELGDDARAEDALDLCDTWPQSEAPGGWLDKFDADRRMTADGMPASTGYHLYQAIAELKRVAGRLAARAS